MSDLTGMSAEARSKLSRSLFGLAFVLVLLAGPTLYVSTVIDDEDAFVAVADEVVAHPDVRQAIAGEVTELTFEAVEADETIAEILPEGLRTFSVPLTAIASEQLTDAAFVLLDTDIAVDARSTALREVHRQVTVDSDEVTVDLRAVLVRTSREVGGSTIGAGVAKLVSGSDAGRFTLAEADSPESKLLAAVRAVPGFGWTVGLSAVVAIVAAILVSNDRRRSLVVGGFVLASAAIVSSVIVTLVLAIVLSSLTGTSAVGDAVVEVVGADFAQQQRGAVVYGLILAAIGALLGNRPSVVAMRGLPGDLWNRRPGTLGAVNALVSDNPPVARAVTWGAGLFTVMAWTTPSWRVLLTIIGLTLAAQMFIWTFVSPSDRAEGWRARLQVSSAASTDLADAAGARSMGRVRVNLLVLTLVIFVFWPEWSRSSVAAFFVIGAFLQAITDIPAARRLARAEAVAEPARAKSVAGDGRRRRFVAAGAVAVGALALAALGTSASAERVEASVECNGSVDLCDRRIDEVVFAGSHNSMSSSDLGWELALQTGDMVTQLDYGIRALLIDAHYWDNEGTVEGGDDPAARFLIEAALSDDQPKPGTWLCHGFCALGATDLTGGLTDVDLWLEAHPREVLLIVVQDEISVGDLTEAFDSSGLLARAHVHETGTSFPTLQALIDAEERIIVWAENAGEPGTWLQNGYADDFGETPFTFALRSEFSCASNRGSADNPLLLVNHWLTTGIPVREVAAAVNSRDALLERVRDCEAERGRLPTILATDFVQTGDVIEVVAELNGVTE